MMDVASNASGSGKEEEELVIVLHIEEGKFEFFTLLLYVFF